jgi:preprotein translocase subunit SecE
MTQPMNRETKRMLQRSGQIGADGTPAPRERTSPVASPKAERTPPRQFLREVVAELRKVAWPTRPEIINFSTVTVVMLMIMMALVFVLDLGFAKGVYALFR